jgi:large subunit ribosomal protein L28
MSRVCQITGARARRGNRIHHSGLAKKKGGIGLNHVKEVGRTFAPNLRHKRIWVPELETFVRVRLTARALKTITKNGAYATLKEAGLI